MNIKEILINLKNKQISVEEAYAQLKNLPYEDLGFAKIDHHRSMRKGFPEVIYCQGKTPGQIAKIAKKLAKKKQNVLATRADKKAFLAVKKSLKKAKYHEEARIVSLKRKQSLEHRTQNTGIISIVTAGTSDIAVAEEASVTAEFLGHKVNKFYDVGVAGLHRLLKNIKEIAQADVLIVVAGMEGALPSVIGGIIDKPIIAVPTSVGYGSNFKGLSALLTMMNSCAPGVSVVNIDNGFGAAVMAHTILTTNYQRPNTNKDIILQIETNIDDMSPKLYSQAIKKIMKAGALDVYITPILMKKNRQAINLVVLCKPEDRDHILEAIFDQTTTLGVRIQTIAREKLAKKIVKVKTKYGKARVKLGYLGNKLKTVAPEYEDYKRMAQKHSIPLKLSCDEILRTFEP